MHHTISGKYAICCIAVILSTAVVVPLFLLSHFALVHDGVIFFGFYLRWALGDFSPSPSLSLSLPFVPFLVWREYAESNATINWVFIATHTHTHREHEPVVSVWCVYATVKEWMQKPLHFSTALKNNIYIASGRESVSVCVSYACVCFDCCSTCAYRFNWNVVYLLERNRDFWNVWDFFLSSFSLFF